MDSNGLGWIFEFQEQTDFKTHFVENDFSIIKFVVLQEETVCASS